MNLYDLKKLQFSRYGAYMTIGHCGAWQDRPEGLCLRTVHGAAPQRETFFIQVFQNGKPVPTKTTFTPTLLTLTCDGGKVEFCFPEPDRLHVKVQGCSLSLRYIGGTYGRCFPARKQQWIVNGGNNWTQYRFTGIHGEMKVVSDPRCSSPFDMTVIIQPRAGGVGEAVIEDFQRNAPATSRFGTFQKSARDVAREFKTWSNTFAPAPAGLEAARELALYVNWSSVVAPSGPLKRPGMLMSKNWMTNIWSWDHAFNAMALSRAQPELAWDQFMIPFDHQDTSGLIPDQVNDQTVYWNYTKPPIHGWALNWMLDHGFKLTQPMLKEGYAKLCAWTDWWFTYRDYDRDGFPQSHDGDHGWDNGTCFQLFPPYRGPEIAAYLVLQLDLLARLARMLKRSKDAIRREQQAEKLLQRLLKTAWVKDRFVTRRGNSHEFVTDSDCLINMLPVVLGKRLPLAQRRAVIDALKEPGRFLTANGLATESVRSSKYEANGYWRGPIWAPPSMLVIDGLSRGSEEAFAQELAGRFCRMCACSGFAENFDALSGAGLCDPAYTWTSSVFLILSTHYLKTHNPDVSCPAD